jgi:hypothetical protein
MVIYRRSLSEYLLTMALYRSTRVSSLHEALLVQARDPVCNQWES